MKDEIEKKEAVERKLTEVQEQEKHSQEQEKRLKDEIEKREATERKLAEMQEQLEP